MDIVFYDLDLNKIHVLPASSKGVGFVSMNGKEEMRGSGSLQLLFYDEELKRKIREYPEGVILKFGKFEGLVTDYQFKGHEMRLYGSHLNVLLHRAVLPRVLISATAPEDAETVIYRLLADACPWLSLAQKKGEFEEISYDSDVYKPGDEVIDEIAKRAGAGYRISLNLAEKRYVFEMIQIEQNPLMLSKGNLNAYDFQEDFDGKEAAFGGWYRERIETEDGSNSGDYEWKYIATAEKSGVRRIDVVLSSETEDEAFQELRAMVPVLTLTAKTKSIAFGEDYEIGDIVRVQNDGMTEKKLVFGVEIWHEAGEYNEKPILEEYTIQESEGSN